MSPKLIFIVQALVVAGLFGNVEALWRLQCEGIVAIAPIDPIISPGETGSHVHTVKGSNGTCSLYLVLVIDIMSSIR